MKRLLISLLACASAIGADLTFDEVTLGDGRILKDVTVKSFNNNNGKVVVKTNGTITTIPLVQFPESAINAIYQQYNGRFSSVSTVPQSDQVIPPERPVRYRAQPSAPDASTSGSQGAHVAAARARAQRFFSYEYRLGASNAIVTQRSIELTQTEQVPGWTGRYRSKGKAYLSFYNSAGGSFQRTAVNFEVETEERPGQGVSVVRLDVTP